MPAPIVKGIIISLSLLAALGIAVLENPQVKEWIEEQRRKIAEALRSLGEDLSPQERRQAEAFAFEGRLPLQTREESAASVNAVARATGRETSDNATPRRIRMVDQSQEAGDLAQRRRLGREYLARRNQEMLEMEQRAQMRKSSLQESPSTVHNSGSFDKLVNDDGSLKTEEKELPSPPVEEPRLSEKTIVVEEGTAVEEAVPVHNASVTGFQTGSRYADPFGDEFELSDLSLMDRSATPKPPVPPKIALEEKQPMVDVAPMPATDDEIPAENLSYEEQLARALSLSLAGGEAARRARYIDEDDALLSAAIAASLADAEKKERPQDTKSRQPEMSQLVDLAPDPPVSVPQLPAVDASRGLSGFTRLGLQQRAPELLSQDNDELYTLSPELAHATPVQIIDPISIPPYDPYESSSFHSTSNTLESSSKLADTKEEANLTEATVVADDAAPSLINFEDVASQTLMPDQTGARTPTTAATLSPHFERDTISFDADSETDDEFASVVSGHSHAASESEHSLFEVGETMDVESMDDSSDEEEGDGVLTPGSWTDVGSEVGSEDSARV